MSLLSALPVQPADPILALVVAFRADPRPGKLDLGIGVYRDAAGDTPVMRAVTAAERRLVETQGTKAYTGLAGDPGFVEALVALALGGDGAAARVAGAATVGGTGALHHAFRLVRMARPDATVWLPAPTWPNHPAIAAHVGLRTRPYRYADAATGGVAVDAMLADLGAVGAGDVVVVHGCCHNPTGADPTPPEWDAVADVLARTGAVPLVDLAYQGLGDGLEADAAATRMLARRLPETMVAASCSKTFGLYRERAGALMVLGDAPDRARDALATLNRLTYSFPADHGGRVVETILRDATLRADWTAELDAMRARMLDMRRALAAALREATGSDRHGALAGHRGMFSRLSLPHGGVEALRRDHGVYLVGDGRMNVAGLTAQRVPALARAVAAVERAAA